MTSQTSDPPQKARFELRVLGGLELLDGSGRAVGLRTRKSRLLLAYLALSSGQAPTREHLADLLWGERQDEQARGSLRSALSDIRRVLGKTALVVDREFAALDPGMVITDYERLRQAASGDVDNVGGDLASFYPGEFLAGHDYDGEAFMNWIRARRDQARELAVTVLEGMVAGFESEGNRVVATERARELLSLDPLREQSHRTLMRLYAASGERSMAIAQFQSCRQLMQHELGAEPSPETKSLADQIALQDKPPEIDIARPATLANDVAPAIVGHRHRGAVASSAAGSDHPSIAVLPFINMSGDAEQDYFADGITEDIITDLSRVANLSIAARSSTQIYRGAPVRPDRISAELGVRYILEGSVRKSGQSVRIAAQLIDGRTNRQIWAERYDRQLVSIFELQSEIASAIVGELKLNISPGSGGAARARATDNVQAHEHYLRGRALLREMTRRSVELSRDMFERAVALDPNYAQAYAGLADAISMLGFHYDASAKILKSSVVNSRKALKINPGLAEAHCSLARAHSLSSHYDLAEEEFLIAMEIDPRLQEAHYYKGLMHLLDGKPDDAIVALQRSFELANQDLQTGMMLMAGFGAVNNNDQLKVTAGHVLAIAQRRMALNAYDDRAAYVGGMALHALGDREEAIRWAEVAAAFEVEDARASYNMACLFSLLGNVDRSLVFLAKALELGCSPHKISWMRYTDSDMAIARQDPRFAAVFADVS